MIRVAVTQRVDVIPGRDERRDALDQRLVDFLARIDVLPLPMPNGLQARGLLTSWLNGLRPEGLVLSGGNDVGAEPDRDVSENVAIEWAMAARLPVLGLCRGMQSLGVQAGGKLVRVDGHVRTRHVLAGEIARSVNSFHDFALSTVPNGYRVLASAEDRHIEAMRHLHLPIEGWMWHPEREAEFSEDDLVRARRLLHSAQQAPELERSISRGHTWR